MKNLIPDLIGFKLGGVLVQPHTPIIAARVPAQIGHLVRRGVPIAVFDLDSGVYMREVKQATQYPNVLDYAGNVAAVAYGCRLNTAAWFIGLHPGDVGFGEVQSERLIELAHSLKERLERYVPDGAFYISPDPAWRAPGIGALEYCTELLRGRGITIEQPVFVGEDTGDLELAQRARWGFTAADVFWSGQSWNTAWLAGAHQG